jgi:cytidine deaminase
MTCLPTPHPIPSHIMSSFTPLTPSQVAGLHQRALAVAENAHAPYSNFRVGAAILLAPSADIPAETIVTGCNVENASFRLTTCAEQSAIATAVSLHGAHIRLQAVVVVNLNGAVCPPCGACRQTILEFSTPATRIFFPGPNGVTIEASIADLLPHAFVAESLLPTPKTPKP